MAENKTKQVSIEDLCKRLYLCEGVEVKLTGRVAKKTKRTGEVMLFEIRPDDTAIKWKKWIHLKDLFEIHSTSAMRKVYLAADLLDAIKRAVDE